ncbi:MAG: ABC transporter substrate-binding protein [Deltaproteobacteria bacterium]|nr:MAG: ABC transporter substrate-binding protein [Deltaproteobacteria bacterium]
MSSFPETVRGSTPMEISRRRVMLVLLFYLCGPFEALGQNVERVIMAVPGIGLSQLPAFVAQEKGFYKQERLEVLIVVMDGTITTRAMIGGDIDFNLALASGVSAILNGAPVKGVMGMTTRGTQSFMVQRKNRRRERFWRIDASRCFARARASRRGYQGCFHSERGKQRSQACRPQIQKNRRYHSRYGFCAQGRGTGVQKARLSGRSRRNSFHGIDGHDNQAEETAGSN